MLSPYFSVFWVSYLVSVFHEFSCILIEHCIEHVPWEFSGRQCSSVHFSLSELNTCQHSFLGEGSGFYSASGVGGRGFICWSCCRFQNLGEYFFCTLGCVESSSSAAVFDLFVYCSGGVVCTLGDIRIGVGFIFTSLSFCDALVNMV